MTPTQGQSVTNGLVIPPESSPASTSSRRRRTNTTSPIGSHGDGSKVQKVSRACDYCKAKKTKCSGTRPCERCARRKIACEYDAQYLRGRPPTPPVGQHIADPSTSATDAAGDDIVLDSPEPRRSQSVLPAERITTSRVSPDLDVAEIEGQYFDTTSGLTFLHRAYRKLSTQKGSIVPHSSSTEEKHQPLMRVGDRSFKGGAGNLEIPHRDTALELMKFYFDECVVTYRIFHRQTVVDWLEKLLSNAQRKVPLTDELGHAKAATILGILAVVAFRREKIRMAASCLFNESAALAQSDPFFAAAVRLTDAETGLPKLESAQARLIQVLYLLQTSRMNQGWYVFGTTSLITSALGLHRRSGRKVGTGNSSGQDYITVQCQRRVFWVAYTIDKYLSVVFGRPTHYRDHDIDQEFPDCVNDEDMAQWGPSGGEPKEDCYVDAVIFHAR